VQERAKPDTFTHVKRLTWLEWCGVALCAAAVACSAGGDKGDNNGDGEGGGGTGGAGASGGTGGTSDGGFVSVGGSTGGDPGEVADVYGHGPGTLYRLDPVTKEVTTVGQFSPCSGIIDIAIDKQNNIYGTTSGSLWRIDRDTAVCTHIADNNYPNSLSFVPEGALDPANETLVGYFDASYVRIDTTTGAVTPIGSLTGGLASSGDIVSVKNGGTYLTVNGPSCYDCLIEVNPTTGDMTQNWGDVGFQAVYGLAFWGGSAYGFSDYGDLFEISFGATTVTSTPITIPGAPSDLQFWGAGSSTHVPLVPPE
jgi:hypothetical protein